jgi:hypothetical protein
MAIFMKSSGVMPTVPIHDPAARALARCAAHPGPIFHQTELVAGGATSLKLTTGKRKGRVSPASSVPNSVPA